MQATIASILTKIFFTKLAQMRKKKHLMAWAQSVFVADVRKNAHNQLAAHHNAEKAEEVIIFTCANIGNHDIR